MNFIYWTHEENNIVVSNLHVLLNNIPQIYHSHTVVTSMYKTNTSKVGIQSTHTLLHAIIELNILPPFCT